LKLPRRDSLCPGPDIAITFDQSNEES